MRCESNRRKRVAEGMFSRNDSFQAVEEEFDGWEPSCLAFQPQRESRFGW
jgi:hypothetical protein